VSVWVGVQQYRLKLKAEERLARSSQAETDLRLLNAFSELVQEATGTGPFRLSEQVVKFLIDSGHLSDADLDDAVAFKQKIYDRAMLAEIIGVTRSRMASYAIGALARRYDFLRELGIRALSSKSVEYNDPEEVRRLVEQLRRL
jgi:hypothetical protein